MVAEDRAVGSHRMFRPRIIPPSFYSHPDFDCPVIKLGKIEPSKNTQTMRSFKQSLRIVLRRRSSAAYGRIRVGGGRSMRADFQASVGAHEPHHRGGFIGGSTNRSEEHTSEIQSLR